MITYELWSHRWAAQLFAVQLRNGRVTGVCGPLRLPHADRWDLAALLYDYRPEACYRAQEHPEQFVVATRWLRGYRIPVASSRQKLIRRVTAWLTASAATGSYRWIAAHWHQI